MQNLPEPKVLDAALSIWRYHCLDENIPRDISTFDLIVGLGSYDTRVAERCAELYQNAISDKIVFTGAFGNWTKDHFDKTEAETFAEVAMITPTARSITLPRMMKFLNSFNMFFLSVY